MPVALGAAVHAGAAAGDCQRHDHPGTRVYLSWGEKESDKPGALGEYTANALEVCRALLGKGAAVDPYMQPDGTHCEACWAKQVPACMDFLFGGKYE